MDTDGVVIDNETIERDWLKFKSQVISDKAPQEQVSEMRMAFFAGVYNALDLMRVISSDDVPVDVTNQAFNILMTETVCALELIAKTNKQQRGTYSEH